MEDIIYTDVSKNLMVAFQKRNPNELFIQDFDSALLVTDETEGCLPKKTPRKKLSTPHSTSLIDLDGDCLSDLFVTITDQATGKTYYEIYLRREREVAEETGEEFTLNETSFDKTLQGLNSFCLVAREEVPPQTNNLFSFADVDRDAMVDLLFITKNDLSLHVYYNKLGSF